MTAYTTQTGVQIGRCYIPPAMRMQGDAVVIQSALLAKPPKTCLADRAVNWALFAAVIVIIASLIWQAQP